MKNKLKCLLIDLLPLVLWLFVAVLLVAYAVKEQAFDLKKGVLFCAIGLIGNYFLSLLFHELGHLVFAKAHKMSAVKINFGIFTLFTNTGKIKPLTLFGSNAGESEFLPRGKITENQLKSVAFGGLLFNGIYVLGVLAVILFVKNPTLLCLFGAGGASACYLLTVNLLPFDKTSDGAVVLRREYPKAVVNASNLLYVVDQNKTLEEGSFINNSNQPLAIYTNYFITSLNSASEALDLLSKIELDDLATDQEYSLLFPEVLFKACLAGKLSDNLKARAENFFCEEQLTLCDLRAHYVYRLAMGEKQWANSIKKSYENELSGAPSLRKLSENNLFSLIQENN